ncbi:SIMPL domain-containing protein [Patescibacteria group bacterium]|nr:SIMPL domain-containing protein [Patescibacteria group bacterium]
MDNNTCMRHPIWLPIFIALIVGGLYITGKYIEGQDLHPVTISVNGEGKVMAIPDIAEMSFGMQTGRQKTADKAMQILTDKMNAVFASLIREGIEEKDITTQSLSLNPSYDWDEGKRIDEGFEASQNLRVKIRDLDQISAVLSAATVAGANQAGSVSFTIDDPEVLRAQAREKAIKNAEEKAQALAAQLGKRVGKLKGFNEGGGYYEPMYEKAMAMDMAGGMGGGGPIAPPIPAGEQEVSVNVSLVYELK